MTVSGKPRVLQFAQASLPGTLFASEWVPKSARVVVLGSKPKGTGFLQICELDEMKLTVSSAEETPTSLKCGTFCASAPTDRKLVTGSASGEMALWGLNGALNLLRTTKVHEGMVNSIAGCHYAEDSSKMSSEVATGGADGFVRVWDERARQSAASFPPDSSGQECWTVALGNVTSGTHRQLLAGYSNGVIKLFDLVSGSQQWSSNLGSSVTSLAFDRMDIEMNKFSAVCMNSMLHTFDARTLHSEKGFAVCHKAVPGGSTLWGCNPSPHNRELNLINCGDGKLRLYQYHYPTKRRESAGTGVEPAGIAGTSSLLMEEQVCDQPVSDFKWHPEKLGLFCCTALDQCLRVGMVKGLDLL